MISEALNYPLEGDKSDNNLIIGTLLVFASVFVLPIFILAGYFARTIRNANNGEPAPEFEDYTGLFVDGVKIVGVYLVYFIALFAMIVPIAIFGELNEYLGLALFWLYVPAFFLFYYGYPTISYHFGKNLSLKQAFNVKEVVRSILTLRYLKIFLILLGVQIGFTVLQVLMAATIIGLLLVPTSLFFEFVVYAKLLSELE